MMRNDLFAVDKFLVTFICIIWHKDSAEWLHIVRISRIYLSDTLQFETHLVNLLKICSKRTYLLIT